MITDTLTQLNIENVFRGDIVGKEILFFDSLPSTNDRALEIGRQRQDPEGIVVLADMQTRGRGRLGRTWISPAGVNLYFTVLFSPPSSIDETRLITLAAPVAAVRAIRGSAGLKAGIKWPNDILIGGKKAGGILIEMKPLGNKKNLLAVGIGINVNMSVKTLPADIRDLSTSLKTEKDRPVDRLNLLREMLAEMERSYKFLLTGNRGALINEWIRLNSTIGNQVTVKNENSVITGVASGINESGELLITLSSGETETVRTGDITLVKD